MNLQESAEITSMRFVGRAVPEEVALMQQVISLSDVMAQMIETMPDFVLVLNPQRQILAINHTLMRTFGVTDPWQILGKRPGEALGCIHSNEGPDGCGTGNHCFTCGAVGSILEALQENRQAARECRVTIGTDSSTALDLMVMSTPVEINGHPLLVCSLRDIAAEKRREVLERVFFHDVINTAGGIRGLAELLFTDDNLEPKEEQNFKKMMVDLSDSLIAEIKQQRELLAAERGTFEPYLENVSVAQIMHKLYALYVNHDCARERILVLETVPSGTVVTDKGVIQRILGNLIKNALEATPVGGRVTFSARETDTAITFVIRNPGVMSEKVQLQLFQRSFSTKAASGRGIGTYSVKLFGERYLKGKVAFTSREPEGETIFTFSVTRNGDPLGEIGWRV
jgi:nitrogen-specific signal transduction histidine kinase